MQRRIRTRSTNTARKPREFIVAKSAKAQIRVSVWTTPDGDKKLMLTTFIRRKNQDWIRTQGIAVPVNLGDDLVRAINNCLDDYDKS